MFDVRDRVWVSLRVMLNVRWVLDILSISYYTVQQQHSFLKRQRQGTGHAYFSPVHLPLASVRNI